MTDEDVTTMASTVVVTPVEATVVAPPEEAEEPCHDESSVDLAQFFRAFFRSKGTREIVFITMFLALGNGCLVGVIPVTIADRYARLNHGYTGVNCGSLDTKPPPCQAGNDDAQAASAYSNLALSLLAVLGNPVVGSHSDEGGRRPMILASLAVLCIPSVVFLQLLLRPTMDPLWYYLSNSLIGAFNFISLVFASFSDSLPETFRAPGFGLFFAVFFGGYALSPSLPLLLSHFETAVASLALIVVAFILALVLLPETLAEPVREAARRKRQGSQEGNLGYVARICRLVRRPWQDMAILGQNRALALLAAGSFFSSMVFASDGTLVMYYIEEQLDVRDTDVAGMFLVLGLVGLLMQGGAIQPLVQCLGERGVLILTFCCGTFHNFLYGAATNKMTIYVALIASQLTKLNAPVLSSLASKDAGKEEQGRIQGALSALGSIAFSVGPLSMEFIYHRTKNKAHFGPGFMFYFAAGLYAIGTCLIIMVPANFQRDGNNDATTRSDANRLVEPGSLEEPLLQGEGNAVDEAEEEP